MSSTKVNIKKLNTLRAIAVLIVVVSHFSNATNIFGGILGKGAGQFGVMIFFILSGFLMTFLYIDQPFQYKFIRDYFISRIARVIPLFYFIVTVSFATYIIFNYSIYPIHNYFDLLSHLLFLNGTSVMWTIPPEIQFYFIFPFLWYLYSLLGRISFTLLLITLILLLSLFMTQDTTPFSYHNFRINIELPKVIAYFLTGILLSQIYTYSMRFNLDAYNSNFFVLPLAFIPILYPEIFYFIFGIHHKIWTNTWILFAVAIIFLVYILLGTENKYMTNPYWDYVSKISYSVYLLHIPILEFLIKQKWEINMLFIFIIFFIFIFSIASISYYSFESPFRNIIKKKFKVMN